MTLDEKQIQSQISRDRFPHYSENLCRIDKQFYQTFNPSWYLRLLQQMGAESSSDWLGGYAPDVSGYTACEAVSDETSFDTFRSTVSRFLRYLCSETLVLVVSSGYPFGPMSAVARKLKDASLLQLLSDVSEQKTPNTKSYSPFGCNLEFDEWIKYMFFRDAETPEEFGEYVSHIVEEAKFISKRDAVNAFKHSRMLSPLDGDPLQLQFKGELGFKKEIPFALHWADLTVRDDQAGRSEVSSMYFEELDFDSDCQSILASTVVMTLLRDIRLIYHLPNSAQSISIPYIKSEGSHPFRVRIREAASYSWGEN